MKRNCYWCKALFHLFAFPVDNVDITKLTHETIQYLTHFSLQLSRAQLFIIKIKIKFKNILDLVLFLSNEILTI